MEDKIIHWTSNALNQLGSLYEYMTDYSELSGRKYIDGLYAFTERLSKHPESCAPCRHSALKDAGYRCCNFKNHIIIYKLTEIAVVIHGIVHSGRNPDIIMELVS